jgi:hypothetical protein
MEAEQCHESELTFTTNIEAELQVSLALMELLPSCAESF